MNLVALAVAVIGFNGLAVLAGWWLRRRRRDRSVGIRPMDAEDEAFWDTLRDRRRRR